MKGMLLFPNIAMLALCLIDAFLMRKYYRTFYPGVKMPLEWKLIISGLVLFPLLSKGMLLILKSGASTPLTKTLYALPILGAFLLCLGALILWRKFKL